MLVLGIESTCDETACAIVKDGRTILSQVVSSQIDLHAIYGGVIPELACRRHIDVIIPVIHQAVSEAQISLADIDLIAVANGPGLIGALLIGLNVAKALALSLNIPLIGVNHVEAHLYAPLMSQEAPFPSLGVVLSGGHTSLLLMRGIGDYLLIGETIDDAVGEAFDKVAKILGLPYPGGPEIEKMAREGDHKKYPFKAGKISERPFHFSFSGLKTKVLYTVKGQGSKYRDHTIISEQEKRDVCASFQHAAFEDIANKVLGAAKSYDCKSIVLGGGVTNSQYLKTLLHTSVGGIPLFWPSPGLSLDNAAMIAGLGYHCFIKKGCGDPLSLAAETRIHFTAVV
jgi:N6-L-threonylcarbamoyladenine synthase